VTKAKTKIIVSYSAPDVEVENHRRYEMLLDRAVRAERVLEELRRDVADIRSRGVAAQGTADVIEAALDSAERRAKTKATVSPERTAAVRGVVE